MQEVFEKIKQKLEKVSFADYSRKYNYGNISLIRTDSAIEIVDKVAEEYVHDKNVGKNNGWIPCSERLPEIGVDVLVCDEDGGIHVSCIKNGEWSNCLWIYGFDFIIAWQPLPKPYKKEV